MSETISVTIREGRGTALARRLRANGQIPAVLYGHGEETVSLALPADGLAAVIRHGAQVVELSGALTENALIREIQFDAFGSEILHVDLTRVSASERVEVTVPTELRGSAPGLKSGGIVEHVTHEVQIECRAMAIPEKFEVNVNHLELEGVIHASDLELPEGVVMLTEPETVIVHCVEPAPEVEDDGTGEGAEPELIGRKEEDEDSGDD